MGEKTSLYRNKTMDDKLGPYIKRFGGLSPAVTIVADRYSYIMHKETERLWQLFTPDEREFLRSYIHDREFSSAGTIPGAISAEVDGEDEDVLQASIVDRAALLAKLHGLNLGQQFALVDWLEGLQVKG